MPGKPKRPLTARPLLADNQTAAFAELLRPHLRVLEVGSGGSTLWLAQRVALVETIEPDRDWARVLRAAIAKREITNIRIHEVARTQMGAHVARIGGQWDLIFVDGVKEQRAIAIRNGAVLVVPGGYLIADDYNSQINVKPAIDALGATWEVAIITGQKKNPLGRGMVTTQMAICQRPLVAI